MKTKIADRGYSPEFVERILEAESSAQNGNVTKIQDVNDIWADIL